MENTVVSRVDQPKVLVSSTGAFVAVFFLAWLRSSLYLARRVRSSRRGGAAAPIDRPSWLPQPVIPWISTIQPLREFVFQPIFRLIVGMQAWRWAALGF